ncbi:MAG: type II toxin-antitoxin system prevent-host-death family antitoxin [Proteobacteria bacterium]|nr:type II toxin-antitoxin system prevent-host-death family antitoxin [Pseudomonadota bacterium]MCG2741738.1 type II toxin-antitoxin system prevent-host-death family antitoxin [Syntrophaceae bacterium]MBU1743277.1 type II toxin-antitoxin system prevent-host-death family antitoxin [Pseudomonadota bacterium]MBU1965232.1 type II toxin-antitoxin system prevent-host-death family antitoxin [Pseudomonadota bacterium]MBU4370646.1 type II toxin-antitoxin system prevent-host-death family antitoxin [Pseud
MQTIDVNQAKQLFPELIERTISGDEVVITQGGQPVARLVAIIKPPRKQRRFGSARGLIIIADDIDEPLEDFKEYT